MFTCKNLDRYTKQYFDCDENLVLTAVYVGYFSRTEGNPQHYYVAIPGPQFYPKTYKPHQEPLEIQKIEARVETLIEDF